MVIVAKIADIGLPGAPQYFFPKKKPSNVRITVHLDVDKKKIWPSWFSIMFDKIWVEYVNSVTEHFFSSSVAQKTFFS